MTIRTREGFITLLKQILGEDIVAGMIRARISLQSIANQAVLHLFIYGNPLSSEADELRESLRRLEETGTWGFML